MLPRAYAAIIATFFLLKGKGNSTEKEAEMKSLIHQNTPTVPSSYLLSRSLHTFVTKTLE